MDASQKAILKTILYSDIFNFPLTKDEIWFYLMLDKPLTFKEFKLSLNRMSGFLSHENRYFCLKGRENLLTKRRAMHKELTQKMNITQSAVRILALIPTIYFIGLSGSLSMGNADKDDDIDLFLITRRNTLWLTRICALILLQFHNLRRKRGVRKAANKVCLNFLIDETRLEFTSRNVYTAHEIVQVVPLFEVDNYYARFLAANIWVKEFLPNSLAVPKQFLKKNLSWRGKIIYFLLEVFFLEKFAYLLQFYFMRAHRRQERVEKNILGLHPFDYRIYVLKQFAKRLSRYALLTKE